MSDTACGKARLAFPPGTDQWIIDCETAAWNLFAESCVGCASAACVDALWQQYLDTRAECAEGDPDGPEGCGCGGAG